MDVRRKDMNAFRKSKNLVCGVGIRDICACENGITFKSYTVWRSMLKRCYYQKYKTAAYKSCFVADEWLTYSNFKKWYDDNIFECYETIELDKDILFPKNREYGPTTCCLVPESLNLRIHKSKKLGIRKTSTIQEVYKVIIFSNKQQMEYGPFFDYESAFICSITQKEKIIKESAVDYFNKGYIKHNVYLALINWNIKERLIK
jgi:hypothetical protein